MVQGEVTTRLFCFVSLTPGVTEQQGDSPTCSAIPQGEPRPRVPPGLTPSDFPSVQNPTAALLVTPSCPHTVLRYLSTLWGQQEPFIWDFFTGKVFRASSLPQKTVKKTQKHGHGQLPVTHLTWEKWLILAQLYLTNFIFRSFALPRKGRW